MSIARIKDLPYPEDLQGVPEIKEYLKKLYTTLQEEQSERIEDFDVLKIDNMGWKDVRAYAKNTLRKDGLAHAISKISTTATTLLISNQQDVTADATIPSTMTLRFMHGGSLNISTDKTVTINGHVEAGLYQIFEGSGVVSFSAGSVEEVYPEWWGIDGTADEVQINAALTAFNTMKLSSRTYTTTAAIAVTGGKTIIGNGNSTILSGSGAINIVDVTGTRVCLENFKVLADSSVVRGLYLHACRRSKFLNIDLDSADAENKGYSTAIIDIDDTWLNNFENMLLDRGAATGIKVTTACNATKFSGISINGCAGLGFDLTVGFGIGLNNLSIQTCAGGGLEIGYIGGVSIDGFYGEANTTFDVKLTDSNSRGASIHGGYFNVSEEEDHNCITVKGYGHEVGGNSFINLGAGSYQVYIDDASYQCTFKSNESLDASGTAYRKPSGRGNVYLEKVTSFVTRYTVDAPYVVIGEGSDIADRNQASVAIGKDAITKNTNEVALINLSFLKSAAAPTTGTWGQGAWIFKSSAAAGGSPGWVCTHSGTFGAATDNTGDTDGSTAVITGMTDTSDFAVGNYVDVSAGFPITGPYEITTITSTTMTLATASDSAQGDITVDTSDPTFKAMANLAA